MIPLIKLELVRSNIEFKKMKIISILFAVLFSSSYAAPQRNLATGGIKEQHNKGMYISYSTIVPSQPRYFYPVATQISL